MCGTGAGMCGWERGSVDVGEDMCWGWDGVVVGWDAWGRSLHVGGGSDV